jgi:DNA adenine methylase
MTIATQPIKYHGGKSYLAKWLHSLAPPSVQDDPVNGYTHRLIAFAGGLGEFWNWLPIKGISEAVNDANDDLANFWAVLSHRELFDDFQRIVECMPLCDGLWKESGDLLRADDEIPDRDLNRAVAFFVRFRQSRQGLGRDYTTPTTRTRRGMNEQVSAWLSAVEGLPECHARLRRVEIRNMDCLKFIDAYDHPRALFYCDPPYVHSTRSTTGEYQHEMTETQHFDLLKKLAHIKGKFMLSGYHSPMYDGDAERFGWTCHEREIDNKASSAKVKEKKIECCWTNY